MLVSPKPVTVQKNRPTIEEIRDATIDPDALNILKILNIGSCDACTLRSKSGTRLTNRRFYLRMSKLLDSDLIRRTRLAYSITSLGKVFLHFHLMAEYTIYNYWKLKLIDSLIDTPLEYRKKIIDEIISVQEIKQIILSEPIAITHILEENKSSVAPPGDLNRPCRLMVVDDDILFLATLKPTLEQLGYAVHTFGHPYEALKEYVSVGESYYDLAIIDIKMPTLNGLQLYQRIKAVNSSMRVLFLSDLGIGKELVSMLPDIDITNVIEKPINHENIRIAVKGALEQRVNQ